MSRFDPPSDPYGNDRACPICDGPLTYNYLIRGYECNNSHDPEEKETPMQKLTEHEKNQNALKHIARIVADVQSRYNGDHDTDPGLAPVHHTTYALTDAIERLVAVIEAQQAQIDRLLAAVPQADIKE